MRRLGGRLRGLERASAARAEEDGSLILVVFPDDWPAGDTVAYADAWEREDAAAKADLVARHAGHRPGPGTLVIEFRRREDGPQ